jgi:hypothetical protein
MLSLKIVGCFLHCFPNQMFVKSTQAVSAASIQIAVRPVENLAAKMYFLLFLFLFYG